MSKDANISDWKKLEKGIRVRLHPTRKHGLKPDMYFVLRFAAEGAVKQEGLGWASEGWTQAKARALLAQLKEARKTGEGAATLSEKRAEAKAKKEADRIRLEEEKRRAITVKDYWDAYYSPYAKQEKASETWRKEESNFTTWIIPYIGDLALCHLKPADFERIRMEMRGKQRAPRSIQLVFAVMKAVWKHAAHWEYVNGPCPANFIRIGRINNARTRFLTPDEARLLLDKVKELDADAWAFTLACLHTGGRLGEVARLTWGNVDLKSGYLTLLHTKSGKPRAIPLTRQLAELLQLMPKGTPDCLVFRNSVGTQWTAMPAKYRKAIEELKLNAGRADRRDRLVFHSLRHSAASMLLEAGEHIRTIQQIFGWSTLAMVQRYLHPTEESQVRAMASLDAMLSKRPTKVTQFRKLVGK